MKESSSLDFSIIYCLLGSIFSLPIFLYFASNGNLSFNIPSLLSLFIAALASAGALLSVNEAVKKSEVSLAYPLSRTEPVFALFLVFLVLGEPITVIKLIGVFLATIGAYLVMLNERIDILEQLKILKERRSAHLGILSAFLYAVAAVADKYAVKTIQPRIYTFMLLFIMALIYLFYLLFKKKNNFERIGKSFRMHSILYIAVSLVLVVSYYAFVKALSLADASRVVPVIQVEILISIVGGHIFYREENIREKLIGASILITGIILVAAPEIIP
jgi:transporter family protein